MLKYILSFMNLQSERVQFYSLNIASFLAQCGISMVNLALVYYLRYTLNMPSQVIGLAASTYTSIYLISCICMGRVYQRFTPRHVITCSVIGMSLATLGIIFTKNIYLIFLFLILYGFTMSMLWPQMEAWITREKESKELNRATSAFNFSWSFGTSLSPYFASALILISPTSGLFGGVSLFLIVAAIIFLISLNKDIRSIKAEKEHIKESRDIVDHSTPLRFDSYIALFLVYTALSVVLNIFPLYTKEQLNLSESVNGFLLLLRGGATCLSFIYFGKSSWWQFKYKYIILTEVAFILLTLTFYNQTSIASLAIFMVIYGLIFSLCYSFSIFHSASGAIDRGKRMVVHECVLTVGQVIGSLIGGGIYDSLGYEKVILSICYTSIICVLIQLGVKIKKASFLK